MFFETYMETMETDICKKRDLFFPLVAYFTKQLMMQAQIVYHF